MDPSPLRGSAALRQTDTQKRRRKIFIVAAVLVALVACFLLWRYLSSYESTDDAQADVHLYPVSARVSGYVIEVNVDDNQWVQKARAGRDRSERLRSRGRSGPSQSRQRRSYRPIAEHHCAYYFREHSSQLKSTTSDVENAKPELSPLKASSPPLMPNWKQAEANDMKAQDDLQRYKLLVDKQEVAVQVYDQALATAKASTASVAAARANESAAQQFVEQAGSRLAQAEANHQSAETAPQQVSSTRARARRRDRRCGAKTRALEQAQLNLQYTKIVAPVSGEVNKTVVVGLNVQPGQQLLTVVPLDQVWVTANFKETQLRHMRVGQSAEIHVDSSGQTLKGPCRQHRGSHGPALQSASAGKRHRQLRKNCAEDSRKDCSRTGREPRPPASARHERRARRLPAMSSAALTIDQDVWRPKYNPWLIAVVVALAAFMEVLDTSIANVALPYMAGNLGGEQRPEHVGPHVLSRIKRHHSPDQWLARQHLRTKALFHGLFSYLYGQFPALRLRAESRVSASLPCAARRGRRRASAHGSSHPGRHFSASSARLGICAVWHYRHHGTHDRSNPRRLDHIQLFLALDFFH